MVKCKWYIQEHSRPGPRVNLFWNGKVAGTHHKELSPTPLPKAKPRAPWGLQCTKVPLNNGAWFIAGWAKLKATTPKPTLEDRLKFIVKVSDGTFYFPYSPQASGITDCWNSFLKNPPRIDFYLSHVLVHTP